MPNTQQPPTHNEVDVERKEIEEEEKEYMCKIHTAEKGCECCENAKDLSCLFDRKIVLLLLAQKKQIEERMPKERETTANDEDGYTISIPYNRGWNACLAAVKEALSE